MVLYRALYGDCGLWVRPAAMFGETVLVGGKSAPALSKCLTRAQKAQRPAQV